MKTTIRSKRALPSDLTIKKVKKDIPTVIEVSGRRYVHDNADTYKG